jgi:hypothetical protein
MLNSANVKKELISQAHTKKKKNTQDLIPDLLLFFLVWSCFSTTYQQILSRSSKKLLIFILYSTLNLLKLNIFKSGLPDLSSFNVKWISWKCWCINSTFILHILHNLHIDLYPYCVVHLSMFKLVCQLQPVLFFNFCCSSCLCRFWRAIYICGQLSCFIGSAHTECLWVIGVLGFAHKFLAQTLTWCVSDISIILCPLVY